MRATRVSITPYNLFSFKQQANNGFAGYYLNLSV
jgi:hypothetical protein